jgi:hypothetical protein
MHNLNRGKITRKTWATLCKFQKAAQSKQSSNGGKSPNLVTLTRNHMAWVLFTINNFSDQVFFSF